MSERNVFAGSREHQIAAQQPEDRLAMFFRDGCVQAERAIGGVPLPSEGNNGVAVAQQPSISGICGGIPVTTIHQTYNAGMATVRNLEQKRTITLAGSFWAQGHEIGGELDLAVAQVDGLIEVDDASIV